jgi:hypothetical protein
LLTIVDKKKSPKRQKIDNIQLNQLLNKLAQALHYGHCFLINLGHLDSLRWILATPNASYRGVNFEQCLGLVKVHNNEMAYLAKPFKSRRISPE